MTKQKLNEKLARWTGLKAAPLSPTEFGYPDFTHSLDACFEWLVPKLRVDGKYPYLNEIIIDLTTCDTEIYYCHMRCDMLHDDGCIEMEDTQSSGEIPALALCKAIEKLIDGEK